MVQIAGKATSVLKNLNIEDTLFINKVPFTGNSPANQIIVNQESDFPTQNGSTITLDEGINYSQGADISTAKRFIVKPDASITANNLFTPMLTYTGTGAMFTGDNASFDIHDINVSAPNSSKYFSWPETIPFSSLVSMDGVTFTDGVAFGDFGNVAALAISFCNATSLSADGITLTGSSNILLSINQLAMVSASNSFKGIDIGSAIVTTIEINNLIVVAPSGAFAISGLANSGNLPVNTLGNITNCNFSGGMTGTGLENISIDDIRWAFRDNNTIPDTSPDILLSLTGNPTTTAVSGGTPIILAGTWNSVERASHFTGTTSGRATFNGERSLAAPVDISVTVEPASGNNKDISAYIAIDGAFVANSKTTVRVDSANPKVIAIPWQVDFDEDKFVEIYVSNDTDNIAVLGTSAILRVR